MNILIGIATVILFILTVVFIFAKYRENTRENTLALNALNVRERLAQDMHGVLIIVRALAIAHANTPELRTNLIATMAEANMLCQHCPLGDSELCKQCGRFASGEGLKLEEQKS